MAHFSLWAVAKAPLVLGNDMRSVPLDVLNVISNPEVIAVSQDKLGKQGTRLSYSMYASLSKGLLILIFFYRATSASTYGNILYADTCNGSPAQKFSIKGNTIT